MKLKRNKFTSFGGAGRQRKSFCYGIKDIQILITC